MSIKEKNIINDRLISCKSHQRLYRSNAGRGWVSCKKDTMIRKNKTGGIDVLLKNARPFHGMPAGFFDAFGWESVKITPDMVDKIIAVFVGEEIKTGDLQLTKDQKKFRDVLISMGGIHREIRDH